MAENPSTALTVRAGKLPAKSATERPETAAEKFIRLANGRADEAISAIERIGNLASPAYEYTERQVNALDKALRDATSAAIQRLRLKTAKADRRRQVL